MELTKDSVVAVKEAQKRVAADWRSGFHSRGIQAEPKRRKKQIRCFRTAARWKAAGKKKPIEKKSSVAVAKKVAIIKAPPSTPLVQPLENKASNYTRSSKGTRMIQQQVSRLLEMDVLAFPSKPMFDAETKICRIKYLNIFMRFFDVKNVYICFFLGGVSALIFLI